MKTPVLHFVFLALLGSFLTPLSVAYASPSPADSAHFCQVIDLEEWEREQPLPAAKRTALNAGESRIVRLFYFLPNDRPERAAVVEDMKTGILEVQSFYREQMAAHGYGNKTFQIETDAQGVPIVHRVNGDYSDSHYKDRGRPENEIRRAFDTSSIVQLVVMDISRSSGGRGVGIKQRGQAIVDGGWNWRTAAHELGHAFGLQHDFRDDAYIMGYGSGRNSLSAGAAQFLAVNPYFNSSIPLQAGSAPSVQLLSSTQYSYGATSVPVQVRVRDADGLQQVILFVKTPEGVNLPTGYNEVVSYHNLSSRTDATVTFNYKGGLPSEGDADTSLLDQLRHTIYVSAVDKQGNRIDWPSAWTLQAINIPQANVPVRERSPQVRESIYQVVSRSQDRSVSSYEQITDAHLAAINTLFVNNIHASDSPLQSNDLDGLTGLESLELRFDAGFSEESLLPAGIFAGLTSLGRLQFFYYKNIYGDDPSLYPILPLPVGLEKVGEGQFKVVVPHGAPFDMDLPLHVVNGRINGGATTITIPRGSVESAPFTVTRIPSTTAAVIVDIETFPSFPKFTDGTGRHSGYSFYRSSFPLEMFSPLPGAPTPVTERTPQVLDAIVAAVPEINHVHHDREITYIVNGRFTEETSNFGHYVSEAHLAAITSLDVSGSSGGDLSLGGNWFSLQGNATELKPGDFDGLTNLTELRLDDNELSSLPESIFDQITNLTELKLDGNQLSALPDGLFDQLTNLTELALSNNQLSALPSGVFDQLTNLTTLTLNSNQLSALPSGVFDQLTNLTRLYLNSNQLSALPSGLFDQLTSLALLNLFDNPLSSLQESDFDHLTNLTSLILPSNSNPSNLSLEFSGDTPVCDRTPQVRDAIVAAVPGVSTCRDVTEAHLAAITDTLELSGSSITELKPGDFDNLTNLRGLGLVDTQLSSLPEDIFEYLINLELFGLGNNTQLSSLPEDIFENLTNLRTLGLVNNTQLSSLPDGLFENLTNLRMLILSGNQLSSLPEGLFEYQTNLTMLDLSGNQLSSLPDGLFNKVTLLILSGNQLSSLPEGLFDRVTSTLNLSDNQLSSLPDGLFKGIFDEPPDFTGFELFGNPLGPVPEDADFPTSLDLTGNPGAPLPLIVSLEKVADGQFKVVVPAGAPFDMVLPLTVANGSISGGATTITIPSGSVESETLTITRTSGTTFAVTVDIGTLPELPSDHSGYALVKSTDLPLVFTEFGGMLSVCDRTPQVRYEIRSRTGISACSAITEAHLAAITRLELNYGDIYYGDITALKLSDFDGLTNLRELNLDHNQLSSLPAGLFDNLTALETLHLHNNQLSSLPAGLFDNLTALETLHLHNNQLSSLPAGLFDNLTALETLDLDDNQLSSLPAGLFDNLTALQQLFLNGNQLSALPDGLFGNLTALEGLYLYDNQLSSLPTGLFDNLTALQQLFLNGNQLSALPDGLFGNLTALEGLYLYDNQLSSLPAGLFGNLTNLPELYLHDNQLSSLPAGLFGNLTNPTYIELGNNQLSSLPAGLFGNPTELFLGLNDNQLSSLPAGLFGNLTNLTYLNLTDNLINPLPLTVSLEKVAEGQFKAVAPSGAPFEMVLPLTVANGNISGGATTITIPAGSLESELLTVTRTPGTTSAVTVDIGTLPGLPTNHSGYAFVKSSDLPLAVIDPLAGAPTPACDRTPQVRDEIVRVVQGVSTCGDVTEAHLASIEGLYPQKEMITALKTGDFDRLPSLTELSLRGNQLSSLPEDVFSGLSALTRLDLDDNQLSSLPEDVFSGLSSLSLLNLYDNQLSSLPEDVFSGLSSLTSLGLADNQLSSLPAGVFSGLSSLSWLDLRNNQLSSLPAGVFSGLSSLTSLWLFDNQLSSLPEDVFSGLSSLELLGLQNNQLSSLPARVFSGLSSLELLRLQGNSSLLPLTVSLESVGETQFKATVHTGAPFTIVLPLSVSNGSIDGGATTITIPIGSVESEPLTVSRTPSTTFAVTVDIGTLPGLPTNQDSDGRFHQGYALAKSADLPLAFPELGGAVFTSVCDRTPQVRDAIVAAVSGVSNCRNVTEAHLAAITILDLQRKGITALKAGDFDGLNSLIRLWLRYNELSTLPVDIFDGLTSLTTLYLNSNALTSLPEGIFDGLTELRDLHLSDNALTSLPAGIFDGLAELRLIWLSGNALTSLPAGVFDGLTEPLIELVLSDNAVNPLPLTVSLEKVGANQFKAVAPSGVPFDIVLPLTLTNGSITGGASTLTIPVGSVESETLTVTRTPGTTFAVTVNIGDPLPVLSGRHQGYALVKSADLPLEVFSRLAGGITPVCDRTLQVQTAILAGLQLQNPSPSTCGEVTETHLASGITSLFLNGQSITTLQADDFAGLTSLTELRLYDNQLTTLPADLFDGLTALTTLYLNGNQLTTLPEGLFDGLSSLTTLYLYGNSVDPLPLTVSLEKIGADQVKAVAPSGAPFEMVLPLTVANGDISGGATSITIPAGSLESQPLTVTRTPSTTAAVTMDIGTLPRPPTNHSGYTLVKSADLPLEIISATTPNTAAVNIPDANLRAQIETALGKTSGDPISAAEMATLTSLAAQDASISDLTGLETATNLTELQLWDNNIADISAVAGLTKLTKLYLWGNAIADISHVAALTNLTDLRLGENSIANVSAVAALTNLTHLGLRENSVSDIAAVSGLTNLTELRIGDNTISSIAAVANLTKLEWLDAPNNSISDIAAVTNLTSLTSLTMSGNSISDLSAVAGLTNLLELYLAENAVSDLSPLVANTGLGADTEIDVQGNPLSYPSIYTHIPALQARSVFIDFDNRTPTTLAKVSGDSQQGTPETALAQPFVVEVQDGNGVAFEGVPLAFAVTAGGGTLSATSTTTDTNGQAQSTLTLGTSAGTNTVSVSAQGIAQSETFTAEATTTNTAVGEGTEVTTYNVGDTIPLPTGFQTPRLTIGSGRAITAANGTYTCVAAVNCIIANGAVTQGTIEVTTSAVASNTDETPVVSALTPVCDRTPQVRDEIVAAVPSVSDCNDVTEAHLAAITGTLSLIGESITALAAGDFAGLTALENLNLRVNPLTTLPAGVFDGLTALELLLLADNDLTTLPAGVFDGLTALTELDLQSNDLTTLPAGVFDGLTALELLLLQGNALTTLPAGVFEDLTSLTGLALSDNPGAPFAPKAVALPDDGTVPVAGGTVTLDGSGSGGPWGTNVTYGWALTSPASGVTVTFDDDTSATPVVTIPALTEGTELTFTLTVTAVPSGATGTTPAPDTAPVTATASTAGICGRTAEVRDALLERIEVNEGAAVACADVTDAHLTSDITSLFLNGQGITTLQADDFKGLTGLTELRLYDNQLTTLPADLFDGLTALTTLYLNGNQLSSLPDGLFDGLASLATLYLYGNSVDPLLLTVSLEKVGTDQVKAVAPAGAPFEIVLPLTVANGDISSGATSITIPAGSLESQPLTVVRTSGTTAAVTVDIGTLPGLPANHSGYALVKSADLPLEIISATTPNTATVNIPDANLRANIETALGKTSGDPISPAEMATLTSLAAQDASISDLTGLETATNLTELQLWDNEISDIAAVAGLTNLTKLYLWGNAITDISHVAALTNLTDLRLGENSIANISAVANLTNLTHLGLRENAVSDIAAVAGLTKLTELRIGDNTISSIAAVANLTNLEWLDAPNNRISDIAAVTNLTNLTSLTMSGNSITDLSAVVGLTNLLELYLAENAISDLSPLVANTGLGANTEIDVLGNPLDYPSIYTHIPALQARSVFIDFDNRTPTTLVKVSGDSQQGTSGTALAQPFVVEVQDGESAAFAGVPVVFAVTAGGGTLSATSTTTDANGQAASTLTLGTNAGTNTVQVRVQGIAQAATFTAEATTTNTAVGEGTEVTTYNVDDAIPLPSGFQTARLTIGSGRAVTADNGTYTCVAAVDCIIANGAISQGTIEVTTSAVASNNAPEFTDGVSTTLSVAENTVAGVNLGAAIAATDADNDVLTYTLGGTDAAAFAIDSTTGQVQTSAALDYETTSSYSVVVTVSDGSLTDTINVTINVTDLDESLIPVCDRTPQMRDAIVAVVPGVSTCGEVTKAHLTSDITSLFLKGQSITALQAGDFDGLNALRVLNLQDNQLSSLPEGIFDNLSALTWLGLENNQLTTLPEGIFDGLNSLTTLGLALNRLTTLPEGIFDNLSALTWLGLASNRLTTLPEGIFDNLNALGGLHLAGNQLSTLPAGVFSGLSSLTSLYLDGNSVDPLPLTVSLEKVGADQVKAVAPSGAPFDMVLPLTVTNGSISGGATTLTIPAGSLESQPLTVTRTPGTTAAVTVDIGTLPGLPTNHSGYALVKSDDLPLEIFSLLAGGICDRTSQVQTAILAGLQAQNPSPSTCAEVTAAHLATGITSLFLNGQSLTALQAGDFAGLTSLQELRLYDNQLTTLPDGLFDGLTALTTLYLNGNQLSTLPDGLFDGLSALTTLYLYGNSVDPLPLTVSLQKVGADQVKAVAPAGAPFEIVLPLTVANGGLSSGATTITIPAGSLESQPLTVTRTPSTTAAVTMDIGTLPRPPTNHSGYALVKSADLPLEVIGATTPNTAAVNIPDANLRAKIETALGKTSGDPISAAEMATLTSLAAQDASISDLTGLETATNLTELQLWDNEISNISAVAGLTKLTKLYLWGNAITDISHVAALTNLTHLRLGENSIANVSAVAALTNLTHLYLRENSVSDIAAVAGLTNLTELRIGDNTISSIAAVANLTNLVWLDAPNNSISDLAAVANLTSLTSLTMSGNSISDLSAVAGLTDLLELFLAENAVSDLSPLVSNTGLGENTEIDVQGNPLSYPSIYTHIPALQARSIFIEFDNRTPTTLAKVSGDSQQGTSGTALAQPFVVEVQDANSGAFVGVPVAFAITAGGGTLSATSTATDANGRAASTLTLGNSAGTNTVQVSVQGISQTETFTAEATTTDTDIADDEPLSETTYASGEEVPTLPTGFWTPDETRQAAFSFSGGKVTIEFNNAGEIVKDGITYTCASTEGCTIEDTRVTKGIVRVIGAGSEEPPTTTNNAPVFTDGANITRTIAENTSAGVNISTAIAATDADNDVLTYTLGGTDAAAFAIDSATGQLKTNAALDYETKSSYSVVVTVSDDSLTDTINVTIDVTDLDESLIPVCDRTPQMRDAIVAAVPSVSTCGEVTKAHLTSDITSLFLNGQSLTALKAGDFEDLTSLTELRLYDNQLTTLPADLFDGLSALTMLYLNGNQLSTLPDGLFDGLTGLATLYLYGNTVDPLPLTVSLEKVGTDQVKAVAPAGAPFDLVLPLTVTNGSLSGGATTITIPAGSLESQPLTVTRTSGTTAAVTMDIGTLPRPPTNHSGYTLVKSADLPLEVIGATATSTARAETAVNIPDANLRAKIETVLGKKTSGDPISPAEMATLTALSAQDASISDLTGLETATNLTELQLWDNEIADIAAVAGLTKLTKLYLWGNAITDISHVAALTNLTDLRLGENSIANVSAVAALTNLTHLGLRENSVSDMAAVAGLTNLTELRIGDNTISSIAAVANLTNLVWLDAPNNSISDMAAVTNLTNLTSLTMSGNSITDLSAVAGLTNLLELYLAENAVSDLSPLVANTGLGADNEIDVLGNPLDYPSIYTHIPALQARSVFIDFDNRTPTTLVKVSGDSQQGTSGTALAQPFVVEVQDANSVAFAGVPVAFAVTAGGGTLSATSTATDANGRAQSTLTLGNSAGTNTVGASAQGISQTATFTAEATTTNTAVDESTAVTLELSPTEVAEDAGATTLTVTGTLNGAALTTATDVRLTISGTATRDVDYSATVLPLTIPAGSVSGTATLTLSLVDDSVDEDDETVIFTATTTSGLTLSPSSLTVTITDNDTVVSAETTVCDRTPQVRDAIVATVPSVSDCNDVTEAHLAAITSLNLADKSISSLKVGDFDGLSSLTELYLTNNQLTSLPEGVFNGLTALTGLSLAANQLTSLPESVFSGLTALTTLGLSRNQLTSLPESVFSGLTALTTLGLSRNQLTSLPEGVFSGLTALTWLELHANQLTSLPEGVFSGLTALTRLRLGGNAVNQLPLTVSLEKVGTTQFKATVHTGAPFTIVLPLSVANGTIDGGATTITIPIGSVESESLTVSRTSGTTAAVTVDIGTLPGLPTAQDNAGRFHQGYALVKSSDLPLKIFSDLAGGNL